MRFWRDYGRRAARRHGPARTPWRKLAGFGANRGRPASSARDDELPFGGVGGVLTRQKFEDKAA